MTTALLIELAWKSTLTLGATLVILRLLRHRSAAERSWLAHAGLLVTLLLPLASLAPRWQVEAPAPVADVLATPTVVAEPAGVQVPDVWQDEPAEAVATTLVESMPVEPEAWFTAQDAILLYAIPAALLLGFTFVAVLRLFGLKRRANVLVENSWLSALALAQRRMGFKSGTALLVSPDLGSPVSWGVLRPVIVLNEEAIGSKEQAEAIIAHELAHVASLDWAKLLLARVTGALFWFNPLIWLLSKQCHQLREEAADDAVLAHDVPDLDYAELLVGVARHESGALLLAANGVAPSRGSLAQRVTRVLDTSLRRAPARFGWTAGVTLGAGLFAAPLAALSFGTVVESPAAPIRMTTAAVAVAEPRARLAPAAAAALPIAQQAVQVAAAADVTAQAAAAIAADIDKQVALALAAAQPVAAPRPVAAPAAYAPPTPPAPPVPPSPMIELPEFNGISVHSGGKVLLRYGPRQQVRVVGGDPDSVLFAVGGGNLAINGCRNNCSDVVVELVMPEVPETLSLHGGGSIKAAGGFPGASDMAISIHGGGMIDVAAIEVNDVAAAIRGGGVISTRARQDLAASITGGGAIRYWGDPEVSTAVKGGGTVSRGGN